MKFTELDLAGAFVIDIEPHEDSRGFFARTYCRREFVDQGIEISIVQESISFNECRGTIRGMHYQAMPYAERKTVRCTAGSVYDVIVDLRNGSPTYGKWRAIELSTENRRTLYIPPGCAHGFQTLVENTELVYQMDVEFVPALARGVRWDDDSLAITWPIRDGVTISAKDRELPELRNLHLADGT